MLDITSLFLCIPMKRYYNDCYVSSYSSLYKAFVRTTASRGIYFHKNCLPISLSPLSYHYLGKGSTSRKSSCSYSKGHISAHGT